jgi:hypothetical protein
VRRTICDQTLTLWASSPLDRTYESFRALYEFVKQTSASGRDQAFHVASRIIGYMPHCAAGDFFRDITLVRVGRDLSMATFPKCSDWLVSIGAFNPPMGCILK